MSGRRNQRGRGSAYHQTASRLRDKLESRNPSEQQEKHPAFLRGREIGLWYAQRSKQKGENQQNHLVNFFILIKLF